MTKFYFGARWLCASAAHPCGDGPQMVRRAGSRREVRGCSRLVGWGRWGETGRVQWDGGGGERNWQGISSLCNHPLSGRAQGNSRTQTAGEKTLDPQSPQRLLVSASRSLEIHNSTLFNHHTSP